MISVNIALRIPIKIFAPFIAHTIAAKKHKDLQAQHHIKIRPSYTNKMHCATMTAMRRMAASSYRATAGVKWPNSKYLAPKARSSV